MTRSCFLARKSNFTIYARLAQTSPARADQFDRAVNEALEQLGRHPYSAPEFRERFRRLVLSGWHYALFCVVEGERVFVHALLDTRQDPEAIRRRLGL